MGECCPQQQQRRELHEELGTTVKYFCPDAGACLFAAVGSITAGLLLSSGRMGWRRMGGHIKVLQQDEAVRAGQSPRIRPGNPPLHSAFLHDQRTCEMKCIHDSRVFVPCSYCTANETKNKLQCPEFCLPLTVNIKQHNVMSTSKEWK